MTAPQTSEKLNARTISFVGALVEILRSADVEVDWKDISVSSTAKDVSDYDAVILGIAPVLSLSANKPYGVLSMISELKNSNKLKFIIDAPEPSKVHASIRSVCADHAKLTKDLYSKRKDYSQVVSHRKILKKVVDGAEFLLDSMWPTTLYPSFPWSPDKFSATGLPESATNSFCGINVDRPYMLREVTALDSRRVNYWIADAPGSKWTVTTSASLMYPIVSAKYHRMWGDPDIVKHTSMSLGALLGPYDDKLMWWSPRFFQAMNTMTPIATEWRFSETLGNAWNHLAAGIEQLSIIDRYELSAAQREQYVAKLPSIEETKVIIKKEIGIL